METRSTVASGLTPLLDASRRPIYAVDGDRRIVYCNASLASWLGMERAKIVGQFVEYHSLPTEEGAPRREPAGLLTELCPPPAALAGAQCVGTVATLGRDGRLVHRRAEFVPLAGIEHPNCTQDGAIGTSDELAAVLVLLASTDMLSQDLSIKLSAEPTPDELHRAIRRFRQHQAEAYAVEALLGSSSGIEKVRAQVAAAAAGRANVLIRGRRGSGRAHVARSIHYHQISTETPVKLVPLDCAVATEDLLRRTLDSAGKRSGGHRHTLLLLDLEQLSPALEPQLLAAIVDTSWGTRVIATLTLPPTKSIGEQIDIDPAIRRLDPRLLDGVSTITIDMPSLANRLEDLPLLTQCLLEACNKGNPKQIGSVREDALDMLALYRWPGELDELRAAIEAAHAAATTPEITPADLPALIHHAAKAAAIPRRRPPEKIVLDDLLASIEREAIVQALAQASGNKSAAAELLGMTRPRLYRRLVQLGLTSDTTIEFEEDTSQ